MTTRFSRRRLIKGSAMLGRLNDLGRGGWPTSPEPTNSSSTIARQSEAAVAVIADLYSRFGEAPHV